MKLLKLLSFVRNMNMSLLQADKVSSEPCLIDKTLVRELVIKTKNGKFVIALGCRGSLARG